MDPREILVASQFDPEQLVRTREMRCQMGEDGWLCARLECGVTLGAEDVAYCPAHERERAESEQRRLAKHIKTAVHEQAEAFNTQIPPWEHAIADTPAFTTAVHPRLAEEVHTFGGTNLAVFGPTGVGKTTFVIAMLRAHMRSTLIEWRSQVVSVHQLPPRVDIVWTTGHALAAAERRSPLGSEPEIITRAKGAEVLVVDEVGFEPRSPALFEIVNDRYERRSGPTIITSGLTPEEFESPDRYGSALYRRMVESGIGREINLFAGDDG